MLANEDQKMIEIKQLEETIREYGALVGIDKRDGTPPTYFELTYRVPGYVPGPAGQPEVSELHRVSIVLPLGYPDTCPMVKPLTPLFHPQVGKDAYVIAMDWPKIRSLSELVVFIGKMICGEVANVDSTINQEAAAWYKKNPQKIRLGDFTPSKGISSEVLALLDEIVPDHPVDFSEKKHNTSQDVDVGETLVDQEELELESDGKANETSGTLQMEGTEEEEEEDTPYEIAGDIVEDEGQGEAQVPTTQEDSGVTTQEAPVKSQEKLPSVKIIVGILCGVLLVAAFLVYFHDRSIVKESEEIWLTGKKFIENKQFDEALKTAEKAKENLSDVFIMTGESDKLALEIDKTLASNSFIEGQQGGKSGQDQGDESKKVQKIESIIVQARSLKDEGKLIDSRKRYEEALLFAVDNRLETYSEELQRQIDELRFEELLLEAKTMEESENWYDAAEIYKKALNIISSSAEIGSEKQQQVLRKYLTVVSHQAEQLKQSKKEQDLQKAVTILSEGEKLVAENQNLIREDEKREFERLLAGAQMNLVLYEAKQAYENEAWDMAIDKYGKALLLLRFRKEYLENEFGGAEKFIEKTLLMTKIAKELSLATVSKGRDDSSGALEHYNRVIQLLQGDPLAQGKDFQAVFDNAQVQIAKIERQAMIKGKISWLKENYGEIFKKHYPAVNESYLSKPEITLIKDDPDKLVFHLSCVDKSQGRSARLVLDYVNIMKTDKWELYFEKE